MDFHLLLQVFVSKQLWPAHVLCIKTYTVFFPQVFKGTYNGEDVAVKVFRKQYNNQVLLHRYKDLREELTIMSQLDHPRVVSLLGVALRPLCIVLRLAPQGSLKDHLALCPQGIQSNVAHRLLFQAREWTSRFAFVGKMMCSQETVVYVWYLYIQCTIA